MSEIGKKQLKHSVKKLCTNATFNKDEMFCIIYSSINDNETFLVMIYSCLHDIIIIYIFFSFRPPAVYVCLTLEALISNNLAL